MFLSSTSHNMGTCSKSSRTVHRYQTTRGLTLGIRPVHGKGRYKAIALKPPGAETRRIYIASILRPFRAFGTPPELIGQIKYVRKEIRNILEGLHLAAQTPS